MDIALPSPWVVWGSLGALIWAALVRYRWRLLVAHVAIAAVMGLMFAVPRIGLPERVALSLDGTAISQAKGGRFGYQLRDGDAPTARVGDAGVIPLGAVEVLAEGMAVASAPAIGTSRRPISGANGRATIRSAGRVLYQASQVTWVVTAGGYGVATGRLTKGAGPFRLGDRFVGVLRILESAPLGLDQRVSRVTGVLLVGQSTGKSPRGK
jgi:hypothetical protein